MLSWQEITNSPEFKEYSPQEQRTIMRGYLKELAPAWQEYSQVDKEAIVRGMAIEAGLIQEYGTPSFMKEVVGGTFKDIGSSLWSGVVKGGVEFNKLIGLGATPTTRKMFIDKPLESISKSEVENPFYKNFTLNFIEQLGNLGVTLPLDVLTGGAIKGYTLLKNYKILKEIPSFALGMGVRGTIKGTQEGETIPSKLGKGVAGGLEEAAWGTTYGKLAGQGIANAMGTMTGLGTAQVVYEAGKEGRLPTKEELAAGAAYGLAWGTFFSIFPALKQNVEAKERKHLEKLMQDLKDISREKDYSKTKQAVEDFLKTEDVSAITKTAVLKALPSDTTGRMIEGEGFFMLRQPKTILRKHKFIEPEIVNKEGKPIKWNPVTKKYEIVEQPTSLQTTGKISDQGIKEIKTTEPEPPPDTTITTHGQEIKTESQTTPAPTLESISAKIREKGSSFLTPEEIEILKQEGKFTKLPPSALSRQGMSWKIEEAMQEKAKREAEQFVPFDETILYSTPFDPFTMIRGLDKLGKEILTKLFDTPVDKFVRIFADTEGLRFLPRESKDELLRLYYGKLKGRIAKGERISNEIRNELTPKIEKGLTDASIIRYLESPDFRTKLDQFYDNKPHPLKDVAQILENGSKELYERGILLPNQHKKWGNRYLSRLYLSLQEPAEDLGIKGGVKGIAIQKGRKYESIMDDNLKQVRKDLGYIEDAKYNITLSLFKQDKNIAIDDFTRGIIKDPQMMPSPELAVRLPEGINREGINLPEFMSPYYAKKRILPWLKESGIINKEEYLKFAKEIFEKKGILDEIHSGSSNKLPKEMALLGGRDDLSYGVLSGMPVNKDIANIMQGFTIISNPAHLASNLDKLATMTIATFKFAKVPGGIPKTLFKNFTSNIFQWTLSGANPLAIPKRIPQSINDIRKGSERWVEANDNGLFKSNFADEEVLKIFRMMSEVKDQTDMFTVWSKIMTSLPVESVSKLYSAIDDVWKMARFNYAREIEKLSPVDAVIKTQAAHYDYNLTYPLIRAMRDPNIQRSTMWKLLGALFPTFSQKILGQVYDSFMNRPFTTLGVLAAPYLIKKAINDEETKKYGTKYKMMTNSIPDYMDDPNTIAWYDPKEKKLKVINIDWFLPWGQWESAGGTLLEGNIDKAIKEMGGMSSPLYAPMNIKQNMDPFTGREIRDTTQSLPRQALQALGYTAEKTIEPEISAFFRRKIAGGKSKEEIGAQLMGIPYFEYDENDLMLMPRKKIDALKLEINLKKSKLKNQWGRKQISLNEYIEEIKRLNKYQMKRKEEIIKGER